MKSPTVFLVSLLFWIACIQVGYTQSDWLSTPESIDSFREQVESIGPSTTRYSLPKVEDKSIKLGDRKIDIRVYDPGGNAPKPVLIYVHGACWVAGSLSSHDEVSRYLSRESNAMVIAIDYRLAPEFKYPAAHDDVYEATQWVWDNAASLGIDKDRFTIGGESAGAYFAAATALRAADTSSGPNFSFLLLVYAALDGAGSSWTACKNHYFDKIADSRSRYGSPLWVDDLSSMPPTFNILGQFETSRAEEELFMRKLSENGVATSVYMNVGVGHDVGTWASVEGNLAAHEKAIEYINAGFDVAK